MKICISTSGKNHKDFPGLVSILERDFDVLLPERRDLSGLNPLETKENILKICYDFYRAIERCDIFYVYCPNGYIGKAVALEIGYALSHDKPVIKSEVIEDKMIDALIERQAEVNELAKIVEEKLWLLRR